MDDEFTPPTQPFGALVPPPKMPGTAVAAATPSPSRRVRSGSDAPSAVMADCGACSSVRSTPLTRSPTKSPSGSDCGTGDDPRRRERRNAAFSPSSGRAAVLPRASRRALLVEP